MLSLKRVLFLLSEVSQDDLLLMFKEQYVKERDFVRSSIYWMVKSSDVDDLVLETFLKAWRSFKHFEAKSSFKTWIYRIAMNTTYDYLKKSKVNIPELHEELTESRELSIEMSDLISKG
jgi:RNA polymerase sigma-70 factor (ECF subfamily)